MTTTEPLHSWSVAPKTAVQLQRELAPRVETSTPFPVTLPALVAGADVSYTRFAKTLFAAVVVLELPSFRLADHAVVEAAAAFPYVPGLLSFREAPAVLEAFARLKAKPALLMCDGQGIAHPRRFGLACHLGLWLDLPTLGCAKSRFVGEFGALTEEAGGTAPLMDKGQTIGAAVRTKRRTKPLFVSPGHRLDLASAVAWTLASVNGYRVPEPTRQAHLYVNAARRRAAARA